MFEKYISLAAVNNKHIAIATVIIIMSAAALKVTIANEVKTEISNVSANEDVKSLAFYVANSKEALKKNKECYEKNLDMQNDLNCAYSLHALQISHVGGDKTSAYKFNRD